MKFKQFISLVLMGLLMLLFAFSVALASETNPTDTSPPLPQVTETPPVPEQYPDAPVYDGELPPINPQIPAPDTQQNDSSNGGIETIPQGYPSGTLDGSPAFGDNISQALVEPIEAVVIRSWSGCNSDNVIWDDLNTNWANYGAIPIHITYDNPDLCIGPITYAALAASGADVLIISDPAGRGQLYSSDEIGAIQQYAMEGHHLIGTYLVFQYTDVDNRGLAPLFGLQAGLTYGASSIITPTYSFLEAANPLFMRLTPPYASEGYYQSQVPASGIWDASALNGARLVGINDDQSAAILSYHGPNYHATYITTMPEFLGGATDKQFFYNALTYDVIDAVVIRSYMGCSSYSLIWDSLNATWSSYGSVPIHIRYAAPGLCSGTITYDALVASKADVLIISDPAGGTQQYSPAEISAIKQYANEGHNLIGTYLLFQYLTTDNRGLAPLFGIQSGATYSNAFLSEPTYTFQEGGNPLYKHLTAPYASSGYAWSQVPASGSWSAAALNGARLVGTNAAHTAAILAYDAPGYRGIYITNMPEYNGGAADKQFFYNAIRYAVDAVVVRSWSGCTSDNVIWDSLNATSMDYGSYPVHITYNFHGVCDGTITYAALAASRADVLIISNPAYNQSYSADEINAIRQYALEGHHLVGTLQLLYAPGLNDTRALAPLFGLQAGADYTVAETIPTYTFLEGGSPLYNHLTDPYVSIGWPYGQVPLSGVWDAAVLNGARIVGITADEKAAILSYHGPNYHATFITTMPEWNGGPADHQLFYNALTYDVIDAVVVRSWSGCNSGDVIWDSLNATWPSYGVTPIHIRYAAPGLCSGTITYAELVASKADVLIFSDPVGGGQVYTQAEVDAIGQFAQEGHNLIGTYVLFQYDETLDNRALAPLFGCNGSITWSTIATTPTYYFEEAANPVFHGLNEPYVSSGYFYGQVPDGPWSTGARVVGINGPGDAAIIVYDAPAYRAIFVTTMPEYLGGVQDKQFFYNAILYRYQVQMPVILK